METVCRVFCHNSFTVQFVHFATGLNTDDESTFSVEGEVRNMNGKVVGWMYARSDVREVALTPRKGSKTSLLLIVQIGRKN